MATIVKTIKSSGGDYTSRSAWEAGRQGDLVTAGNIEQGDCYNFADTTEFTFAGWTTSSTCYPILTAPQSERHNGVWNTNKARLTVTGSTNAINISIKNVIIEYQQISVVTGKCIADDSTASSVFIIRKNIFRGDGADTANGYGCYILNTPSTGVWKINNNLFYNMNTAVYEYSFLNQKNYIYNNTLADCPVGFYRHDGGLTISNNLSYSCANPYIGNFSSTSNTNSTDVNDDVGSGTGNRKNQTFTFIDSANDDFRIKVSDTGAYNLGTNYYNDANNPFQDDIVDNNRGGADATWSIGMHEPSVDSLPWLDRKPFKHYLRR